jgi:orotate phosphoribosyltransferase
VEKATTNYEMQALWRPVMMYDSRALLLKYMTSKCFKTGKFVLSSGKESDFYINCKKVLDPVGLDLIGKAVCYLILENTPEAEMVGGLTMGADPLSVATSLWSLNHGERVGINCLTPFYVRKEPKKHGTMEFIEGPDFKPGTKVVIMEDVITTGASAIKAIERARANGMVPVLAVALVDRMEDNGRENIEATGVKVVSVFTRKDFIP